MDRRRFLLSALAGVLAAPLAAEAQQAAKVYRIGFLGATSPSGYASQVEAFRGGLRDLGYVEGKDIAIEFRWAEGKYDRLPDLAAELARLRVDVLVTHGTPGTLAGKRATTTIPIVMTAAGNPVASRIVASLARPDGNITGTAIFSSEIVAKRLHLLKEAVPRTGRVAVLTNPDNPVLVTDLQAIEKAARSMKVEIERFEVRGPDQFDGAFAAMTKSRADAVMISQDGMLNSYVRRIADLSIRKRFASTGSAEFATAGGFIGYGVSILAMFRRTAYFVDRILNGARPADLSVEQATKFEMVINLKTAKALGLTIPPSLLLRADQVIE